MYLLINLARMKISSEIVKETDRESSVYFIRAGNQLTLKLSLMWSSTLTELLTAGSPFNFILYRHRKGNAFFPILMADNSC